jgi:hypothetical protein
MTYEEYKNKRSIREKPKFLRNALNKLFTIIIWTMLVIILSNYSPKFKSFLINDVLNTTLDFSYFNKIISKITNIFQVNDKVVPVSKELNKSEKYKDGIKYYVSLNEDVYLKDGGIITFIGEKDGYNNTIIVQQSNGYYAWYGNVKESIKLYDFVEKGSVIGSASNEYYYVLLKDDKPIDINES